LMGVFGNRLPVGDLDERKTSGRSVWIHRCESGAWIFLYVCQLQHAVVYERGGSKDYYSRSFMV